MVDRPQVLVADDDEELRTAVKALLVADGYDVVEASTGADALEMLAIAADGGSRVPDAVLLDFVMPGLSGLGVLRVMRRFPRRPPTILMTAFPDASVEAFAQSAGAFRVLRKPIDPDALRACELMALWR